MTEIYAVTLDGDTVGEVTMQTQGLYYRFHCRCRLPEKQRVSLYADEVDLGILVPDNGYFCLATKVPQKRFSGETIHFRLARKETDEDSILMPVCQDVPFPGLNRLQDASFVVTSDGPAIRLPIK